MYLPIVRNKSVAFLMNYLYIHSALVHFMIVVYILMRKSKNVLSLAIFQWLVKHSDFKHSFHAVT